MAFTKLKGVIFDLDGVITDTARIHALSWEQTFNNFLKQSAQNEGKHFVPFDRSDDYKNYVDGKPRFQGVKSFLQSRGYDLPFGTPEDKPGDDTICAIGNQKNELFQEVLRREGPDVYESTLEFIHTLRKRDIRVGVASSSRNCKLVLKLAKIDHLFDTCVGGLVSAELNLKGKPDPDIFVTAAKNLDLSPGECVVVEDAISGVQAGNAGNFGFTLGIARDGDGALLRRFGADRVVRDMAEIDIAKIENWFERGIERDGWELVYKGFDPGEEKLRETLCAVGNGYLGTRGCFPGERASFFYYPGTYIAGVYNKLPTEIHGRDIYNNDFVNCPNWLLIEFKIGAGEFQSPLQMELLSFSQKLFMREGVAGWSLIVRDTLGRITRINPVQLVSMANPHLCAIRYDITPCNYTDTITVRSSLDGNIINDGVARYRELASKHVQGVEADTSEEGIFLHVETTASKYQVCMDSKTILRENDKILSVEKNITKNDWEITEEFEFEACENSTYSVEKLVAVTTSLDGCLATENNGPNVKKAAAENLAKAKSYAAVYKPHARAWAALWDKVDIRIIGDRFAQKIVRLHCYHMLLAASPHNVNIDAGMTARGLHGEAYRGHVFWDELYIFPYYDLHFPEVTRSLLMYRYNRLDGAREYAKENGYEGAMFPWQTADGGGEETQEVHYNPESKDWGPDLSRRQRHVSIAVYYNTWRYVEQSLDKNFLKKYGAELMLEITRFWASIAELDSKTGKYHIAGVMGPDEFHEKLPGSKEAGLKDNAYTNIMVVWLMEKSLELVKKLSRPALEAIAKKTGFKMKETKKWEAMTKKLHVILTDDNIISQFDGYMELDDLDWDYYRKRYYSIHRMDRLLKAEGDSPDHYKVAKQADTLMTFYVLPPEEVKRILNQLGHHVDDSMDMLKKNYDFYVNRTSHGSTLSKVVHAIISGYIHAGDTVWDWFMEALKSDVQDTQGGTTIEGIHTGVMAGTIDVIIRHFAGVNLLSKTMDISPQIPAHWKNLSFRIQYEKVWFRFEITESAIKVQAEGKGKNQVFIKIFGKEKGLLPGQEKIFRFNKHSLLQE